MTLPAARIGDPTVHGGVITMGMPTVIIGGMPAARIGDMHICPMVTGLVPHVGGPIILGSFTVIVGFQPQARQTDMAVCVGPPDMIAMGCPTVLVGPVGAPGGAGLVGAMLGAMLGTLSNAMGGAVPGDYPRAVQQANGSVVTEYSKGLVIQGDSAFQAQVVNELNTIKGTPTGAKLLTSIDKSGKTVTIVPTTGGNTELAENFTNGLRQANGQPGPGSNTKVEYNPARTVVGDGSESWMTRPPAVGLAHELIHAAHDVNGTTEFDRSDPQKSPQNYEYQAVGLPATKDGQPVDYSTNDYTENKIRAELGEPLRPEY